MVLVKSRPYLLLVHIGITYRSRQKDLIVRLGMEEVGCHVISIDAVQLILVGFLTVTDDGVGTEDVNNRTEGIYHGGLRRQPIKMEKKASVILVEFALLLGE